MTFVSRSLFVWFVIFGVLNHSSTASTVHKPTFGECASWTSTGITIANSASSGNSPYSTFIGKNDTLYIADQTEKTIQIWSGKTNKPEKVITSNNIFSFGLFVTTTGDVYADQGNNSHITKWSFSSIASKIILYINRGCISLFIDTNNTLYCSINDGHQVIKMSLNRNASKLFTVAGTGCAGSTSTMLDQPFGIYVNTNFDLYVADFGNNRIQLFSYGESEGKTVAGQNHSSGFNLSHPTSVILDADDYLFIVDSGNQRIVRSGPNGFACLFGCSEDSCSSPNHLCNPLTAMFDSYGNIYVTNRYMNGIQQYLLSTNSCVQSTFQTTIELTTTAAPSQSTTNPTNLSPTCFPPVITLFPSPSDLDSPLQFRRSQDFYISATLKLKCEASLASNIQWSIFNCTLTNCSTQAKVDHLINTTVSELYVPAKVLIYGVYKFELLVTVTASKSMYSGAVAYAQINPSGITANLVRFGTSVITSGEKKDLILDPGTHSDNPDEASFNASDWSYEYRCRTYDLWNIGESKDIDHPVHPCFSQWKYDTLPCRSNGKNGTLSSIIILAGALAYNHTYQFIVYMRNSRNASSQATGYVIVNVENTRPQMIAVTCRIFGLCSKNQEYQDINPDTQVALYSECMGNCQSLQSIRWYIYQNANQPTKDAVEWIPFLPINASQDLNFFGTNTSRFTTSNTLFVQYSAIQLWRFEVVYTFLNQTSSSSLNFKLNEPPENGTCTITPLNGTTSTLFTINCTDWSDHDGVRDYSFYTVGARPSEELMLGYTIQSHSEIRLPAGTGQTSSHDLIVHIRDFRNCIAKFPMRPVTVLPDREEMNKLIEALQNSNQQGSDNPILQALASGNPSVVGQIVTSLSQEFNKQNKESVELAVADGTSAIMISISALGDQSPSAASSSKPTNTTISPEYIEKLNKLAKTRDYLMQATINLGITNIHSIKLQANSLAQLTESTNELTGASALLASNKCYQLAKDLNATASAVPYEEARFACTQLSRCVNNVLTSINAPLQERGIYLDTDRKNVLANDDDTDPELLSLRLSILSGGADNSADSINNDRILYHQKKMANKIAKLSNETLGLITSIMNIHLNIGQQMTINTTALLFSLQTTSIGSLIETIEQVNNSRLRIPLNFEINLASDTTVSLRTAMQSLAPSGASHSPGYTGLSTAVSLSVIDAHGREVPIHASDENPIEFFIPRDRNLVLPAMTIQDVTSKNTDQLFHLSVIDLTQLVTNRNQTVSVHFEIKPENLTVGYLFIYQFDATTQLDDSLKNIDDWFLMCPSNLTNDSLYIYFLNNRQTAHRKSIAFGLRELNSTEMQRFCEDKPRNHRPIVNEPFNFTSNYYLRVYTSGCYYLDQYNNWQSDGVWVGPLTTHQTTQCFSNHLTTFTSSFFVVPFLIDTNDQRHVLKDMSSLQTNMTKKSSNCTELVFREKTHRCINYWSSISL